MSWRVFESDRVLVADCFLPDPAVEGLKFRRARVKGRDVTIFHHDYKTWRTLRSRGLLPPSPLCYYSWPGRFKPRKHQIETAEHFVLYDRCFCLDPIGSGKTLASIWAADYLQSIGELRRVLVVAPLSIVEHVWERELFKTLPHRRAVVLKGNRDRKLALAVETRFDWLITNPESLHLVADHLPEVGLIVVDEMTRFKTVSTRRYKALRRAAAARRLWLMSGTPAPQSPLDAYAPVRLVNPEKISFLRFRDLTMKRVSQFKWVPRPEADRVIANWMQPSIRHRIEGCYDVPDVQVETVEVDQTPQQRKLVEKFMLAARATLDGKTVTAANAATVLIKVLQVMAGGVYDADREVHYVEAGPYYETLERLVEQADTPVLIFISFRSSALAVTRHLQSKGFNVESVLGGSSASERAVIFDRFKRGELHALVAVPSTMSHGLTLTESRIVVWASPPFSYETYDQANGRVVRQGQTRKVIIYHLVQNSLDRDLFRRLKTKERLQDLILKRLTVEGDDGGRK